MKKLKYLLTGLFIVTAIVSCEKETTVESQLSSMGEKKGVKIVITENIPSSPISDADITPYLIPGKNNGGNRTCAEVGMAFMDDAEYFILCGDKVDYEEGSFDGEFPSGLNITTDGTFLSFEIDGCLEIGGGLYKVGAVIVKGSDNANVYWYPDGAMNDAGLAPPINASGEPAGLSNLTFCFVECEEDQSDLVIAFKSQTTGEPVWTVVEGYTEKMVDYYSFVNGFNGKVYYNGDLSQPFGNIDVGDTDGDGLLEVTIDNTDMPALNFKYESHLFVGTLEDYLAAVTPYQFPYYQVIYTSSSLLTFELDF